ncbi:MAG: alpha/beta hydrolase [Anaerolineaceae bacterium]
MKTVMFFLILCLFLTLFTGCAGAPPTAIIMPTATNPPPASLPTATRLAPTLTLSPQPPTLAPTATPPPFPMFFTGTVQVGPYKLSMTCMGKGQPTIILENGLDSVSWENDALDQFYTISRTCRYLRVGMAGETISGPRTTMDQVKDLHALLTGNSVPGPYILVGHSIAGFNMIVYTDQYPNEVVGLVCVECRYPSVDQIFMTKLGPPGPNDSAVIIKTRAGENKTEDDWTQYNEHLDMRSSDQQVLKVTSLGDRPFVVLVAETRGDPWGDPKMDQLFDESWMEASGILSKLSTKGKIEQVPSTDHWSILSSDMIYPAIQEVFTAVHPGK